MCLIEPNLIVKRSESVTLLFRISTSKALTNPETLISQNPHIWQCQILIDFRTRQGATIGRS